MQLLIMQFFYIVTSSPCGSIKYSTLHLVLKTLNLYSSLNVRDQVSHPYQTASKIIVSYILIFKFLGEDYELNLYAPFLRERNGLDYYSLWGKTTGCDSVFKVLCKHFVTHEYY